MRLPHMGNIVLYHSPQEFKQYPAIVLAVDDRNPADIWLNLSIIQGASLLMVLGARQGSGVGQWQWPDIPIETIT